MKILLASVLKPVNEPRMFGRIAMALTKIDNAEIHIAGFDTSDALLTRKNIVFHPIYSFRRLGIQRLFAGWKMCRLILKVKPEYIICNTHELLGVTVLYKILFGAGIIYDVQENYYFNLWFGDQFPTGIRHFLALFIRLKERILAPFFNAFILAEKCYRNEMPFMGPKSILLENKFYKPESFNIPVLKEKLPLKLVYTGTIGLSYGIFEAIDLARSLMDMEDGSFTVAGYCPNIRILKKLESMISSDSRIRLIGGGKAVNHHEILKHIYRSNLGIMSYRISPSNQQRIPTRFYEYFAHHLPFVYPENPAWHDLISEYPAGIPVNYLRPDPKWILERYLSTDFYTKYPGQEVFFDPDNTSLEEILRRG